VNPAWFRPRGDAPVEVLRLSEAPAPAGAELPWARWTQRRRDASPAPMRTPTPTPRRSPARHATGPAEAYSGLLGISEVAAALERSTRAMSEAHGAFLDQQRRTEEHLREILELAASKLRQ